MHIRLAELEIEPGELAAYRRLLAAEIEASIATEPGVLALQAVAIRGEPTQIRLLEVYADAAAYQAHLNAPHFLHYKSATAAMVRSLRLLEAEPVRLGAKPGFPAA